MEWEKLSNILKAGESEQTEFKESAFLRDNEEIAAQLASFANRKGGEIPIGVRDDAKLEGAKISRDKAQLHILKNPTWNIPSIFGSNTSETIFKFRLCSMLPLQDMSKGQVDPFPFWKS